MNQIEPKPIQINPGTSSTYLSNIKLIDRTLFASVITEQTIKQTDEKQKVFEFQQ